MFYDSILGSVLDFITTHLYYMQLVHASGLWLHKHNYWCVRCDFIAPLCLYNVYIPA